MTECDLCNEEGASEWFLMKKLSHGGPVMLCSDCGDRLTRTRCALCGDPSIPQEAEKQITVSELSEDGKGFAICRGCRNVLDWNHQ